MKIFRASADVTAAIAMTAEALTAALIAAALATIFAVPPAAEPGYAQDSPPHTRLTVTPFVRQELINPE